MTSTKKLIISNAILWAAAILAAAIAGAPQFFTIILLPALACSAIGVITKIGKDDNKDCQS